MENAAIPSKVAAFFIPFLPFQPVDPSFQHLDFLLALLFGVTPKRSC